MPEFVERAFGKDIGTIWSAKQGIQTSIKEHFWTQIREVDNEIFKTRNEVGPQYGGYFIQ